MKYLLTFLLISANFLFVKSQVFCEFETIYPLSTNKAAFQVFEIDNGDLVVFGVDNIPSQRNSNPLTHILMQKFDRCGVKIFEKIIEPKILAFMDVGSSSDIYHRITYNSEAKIFSCLYNYDNSPPIFIEFDLAGNTLNKFSIGTSPQIFFLNDYIKISSNNFAFVGGKRRGINPPTPPKYQSCIVYTDSLGQIKSVKNIKRDSLIDDTTKFSQLFKVTKQNQNELLCIGMDDSLLFISNIDSLANTIKTKSVPTNSYIQSIYTRISISLSFDGRKCLLMCPDKYINSKMYLESIDLLSDNQKIFEFNDSRFNQMKISSAPNNEVIIPNINMNLVRLDSNLNILKKDTIILSNPNNNQSKFLSSSTFTRDSAIVGVGQYAAYSGLNQTTQVFIKKLYMLPHIKSISILGANTISAKHATLQLSANVVPKTVVNPKISWSVNDTSKATIDSNGLVTAIADGDIIVTATAKEDNSIKSTKKITITSQTSSINENEQQRFSFYPNPSQGVIHIQNYNEKVFEVSIYDSHGLMLMTFKDTKIIDIGSIQNGIYFIEIEGLKTNYHSKLVIAK